MSNSENIPWAQVPASIREASVQNFQISKNDMNDPDQKLASPEKYVNVIIADWVASITSELLRSRAPEKWERYPEVFGHRVVLKNEYFPSSLPIGYVLVSFLRSVYPREYRVDAVRRIFNSWISAGRNREALFKAHREGQFMVGGLAQLKNAAAQPEVDMSDGKNQAKYLYDEGQGNFFDQAE